MPAGDGTGPLGMGPMTGWGRGRCAGGPAGRFFGGWGMGRGRGLGRRFWAWGPGPQVEPIDPEQEKGWLRRQADLLKSELDAVTRRLGDLEKPEQT